jgi:hypothetical protein
MTGIIAIAFAAAEGMAGLVVAASIAALSAGSALVQIAVHYKF